MGWADQVRRLGVRANAETPLDARTAREFGAEGIGLCRTEHMFFEADRIVAMREMILADDEAGRRKALAKILPMQRDDFVELFRIMAGLPVTSACSTRRCTSSCRTRRRRWPRSPHATGCRRRDAARQRRRTARSQPDAGPSRLPARPSPTRKSTRCRRARFSRPRSVVQKETGDAVIPEVMIPLVAWREGIHDPEADRLIAWRARCRRKESCKSAIWSAP